MVLGILLGYFLPNVATNPWIEAWPVGPGLAGLGRLATADAGDMFSWAQAAMSKSLGSFGAAIILSLKPDSFVGHRSTLFRTSCIGPECCRGSDPPPSARANRPCTNALEQ